jgi:hypothetical protein
VAGLQDGIEFFDAFLAAIGDKDKETGFDSSS